MKLSAIKKAWAMPSGFACSRYSMDNPQALPFPSNWLNRGRSCGVEMRQSSRIPPSISVVNG